MSFRVGISRDFLHDDGTLKIDIGLDTFAGLPDIEYEFLSDNTPVVTPEQIEKFDAIIIWGPRVDRYTLHRNKKLAVIAKWGVEYDNIDLNACTEADVAVFITPDEVKGPAAISVMTLILALSTNLINKINLVREGRWDDRINHSGIGLRGKVLGSLGLGNLAMEIFKLMKPFDMNYQAYDPYVDPQKVGNQGIHLVDFKTLIRTSDFLCLNCPLTRETYHIIGELELRNMKKGAYLINTAKGGIIDENALVKALQERWIAGAALDVFEKEPLSANNPLLYLDNLILTPHSLSWTDELYRETGEADCRGILKVARGEVPDHVVNKEVLTREGFLEKLHHYAQRKFGVGTMLR